MRSKKYFKVLVVLCAVLLCILVVNDASMINSIATIGGGVHENAIHTIPFTF